MAELIADTIQFFNDRGIPYIARRMSIWMCSRPLAEPYPGDFHTESWPITERYLNLYATLKVVRN
jgi:hypothetical protein